MPGRPCRYHDLPADRPINTRSSTTTGLLEILPIRTPASLEPNPTAKRFLLIGEFARSRFLLTNHIMIRTWGRSALGGAAWVWALGDSARGTRGLPGSPCGGITGEIGMIRRSAASRQP